MGRVSAVLTVVGSSVHHWGTRTDRRSDQETQAMSSEVVNQTSNSILDELQKSGGGHKEAGKEGVAVVPTGGDLHLYEQLSWACGAEGKDRTDIVQGESAYLDLRPDVFRKGQFVVQHSMRFLTDEEGDTVVPSILVISKSNAMYRHLSCVNSKTGASIQYSNILNFILKDIISKSRIFHASSSNSSLHILCFCDVGEMLHGNKHYKAKSNQFCQA